MAFNKTGGFSGGEPPKPAAGTNTVAREGFAKDGFCGGEQFTKGFSGGQITTAQLQSILPQGSTSSVVNPPQPAVAQPVSTPTTSEK